MEVKKKIYKLFYYSCHSYIFMEAQYQFYFISFILFTGIKLPDLKKKKVGITRFLWGPHNTFFNRPSVAGAVLQTAFSLVSSFIH